jgi:DNA-binding NarL/FixJ family response regulator
MDKITIAVADGHKLMREAIIFILENDIRFTVVASCGDAKELKEAVEEFRPDIILLEVMSDTTKVFEVINTIRILSPGTKVIGFSVYLQKGYVRRLLQYGGSGFITKSSSCEETLNGILQVYKGNVYLCDEIRQTDNKYFDDVIKKNTQ